jgi:hypothetical protein
MNKKFELLKEAVGCYKANHVSGDKNEKELLSFISELEAISVTRCCESDSELLKDLEVLSFEDWQEQNQELLRKSIGITGNEIAVELYLYSKYKTDQLLNL